MNNTLILETQYRIYDGLIAFGLFICLVIGLPGNCLALKYFLHTKKRNLSTLLYIVACSIDVGSSVIHLPITFSLLKNRNPGLLDNQSFCLIWTFILLLLQQMSIFVVMTLSLSRVIVIKYPFYKVNKRAVLVSIALYLIYHCIWNTILFTDMHTDMDVSCAIVPSDEPPPFSLLTIFYVFNYSACLGIPPIIVFLTFLVSIVMLQKDRVANNVSQRRNQHASITITYFTGLFLCCNCLTFINCCLLTYAFVYNTYSIYENSFMSFYSWLLSLIFCTVLNASLNPLLYVWRMREMRLWIVGILSNRASSPGVIANSNIETETEL